MIPTADPRETVRLLRSVLDTMQLGVTITDTKGVILFTNPADAALHGYTVDELLGQDVRVFSLPEERRGLTPDQLRSVTSWKRDSHNVRKDGTVFPVQLLSDVVKDTRGEPVGVITTCEDITQRKLVEREFQASRDDLDRRVLERTQDLSLAVTQLLEQIAERERAERQRAALEEQLRQAQKLEAVGQLTGGMAHDFNNLLSVIMGNAEIASAALAQADDETRACLHEILRAARTGAELIERLLGFARQAELRLVPTDLAEVVVGLAGVLRRLIPESIEIQTAIERGAGIVLADRAAIQQILMNLATNARDAMPQGGALRVAVQRLDIPPDSQRRLQPGPGPYVRISVSDTGTGMDERTKQRVFEPFFTTKAPGEGTGLGMAMTYGLVQQHGGSVTLKSELGKGTTVAIYLPIAEEPSAESAEEPARGEPRGGSETVLVVEDDDAIRRVALRTLRQFSYSVLEARNGLEALEILRAWPDEVDLIISDLVMPKLGGRDLLDAVRRDGRTTPFLFASGYSSRDAREWAALGPEIPFIKKPWTMSELAAQVRSTLDLHAARSKPVS